MVSLLVMNRHLKPLIVAAAFAAAVVSVAGQGGPLRPLHIVRADPRGDLASPGDASQIRIVFSEPMVALGTPPPDAAPSWFHISPALRGAFYWSGTDTLAAPYDFTFTTPAARLIRADWYRRDGGADSPLVIALEFNQPVRPDALLPRTRVRLEPRAWTAPMLSARARTDLRRRDPAGLRRFDEKVAAVRRTVTRSEDVAIRLASTWNHERFPPEPELVVIETATAPPRDAAISIATPGNTPHPLWLEPTFFVTGTSCQIECRPDANPIVMTRNVAIGAFAQALTIADLTAPANARAVLSDRKPPAGMAEVAQTRLSPADAGFGNQPSARTWRLQLSADLRSDDGQTLGYPWVEFVETTVADPYLALDGSVLEAASGAKLPVYTRNVQAVHESIAPIPSSELVARLHQLKERTPPPVSAPPRRLPVTPDAEQKHLLDLRRLLAPRQTGFVWVDLALEQLQRITSRASLNVVVSPWALPERARGVIQVTNLGITLKDGPDSGLVFVTRLDTGEAVDNARLTMLGAGNETRWSGTTDREGVAFIPHDAVRPGAEPWSYWYAMTAEKDGDIAFVTSDWPAENRRSYGRWYDDPPTVRGSVFTDRGVYRPGEDVHFKAIVREDMPDGLRALPGGREFDVILDDARGREAARQRVVLNHWSSAEWTWRAPENGGLGEYNVKVVPVDDDGYSDGIAEGSFRVAAFRRPEFRVDTTFTGDPAILGSPLRGGIQASYLFGAALASRPVRWSWYREYAQRPPDAVLARYPADRYVVGYLGDFRDEGNRSSSNETVLGPDGRLTVTIPTEAASGAAYTYHLEADVEGESRQHIANRTSTVVHPSSIYVALSRPPVFVNQKSGTSVRIAAADLSGQTLDDVEVRVSLVRHTWVYHRSTKRDFPGNWELREIPSGEWTVRTSSSTEAVLPIQVHEGGWYVLRATARDAAGRKTRTESGFYATGSGRASWKIDDSTSIRLVPERDRWKPGETARILIQSPWPSATALLTVEREGIRTHRRFAVTSTQDVVDVPITEADVPNVFVSVILVKGRTASGAVDGEDSSAPGHRVGYVELEVDDAPKRLGVAVSADRDEYRPRDPVNVSVAVTTPAGTPATGEVTLWAVDLGVLSLTGYTTPDIVKALYLPKSLRVSTSDSRKRLAGGGSFNLREGWNPDLVQASTGARATLVDETIEDVREDFRPLAFWLGSAATDASGRVRTSVTLPDSLTTYRIMAVAGDGGSRFGFGEHDVRVTKPLTLLAAFPRFLNTGDRAALGAIVTNGSPAEGTAVVTIRSLDPGTLQLTESRQTVHLAAGASQSVTFPAVGGAAGSTRVMLSATLGSATDALQVPVTVARPLVRETTAAHGETSAASTERLTMIDGALRDRGGLTVELASTALVGLGEGVRYLNQYPYGCAEQKSSRALALLLASDLGDAFSLPNVKPAEYRTTAANLLRSLSSNQCSDGGYALWAGKCATGSPYLTAYVLHVMKAAQTLGVELDARAIEEALVFLERDIERPSFESNWWPAWAVSQAYALKVLAEFGRAPGRGMDDMLREADRLPLVALSHLADALAASRDKGPRYQDLVRRLTNAIRVHADRAHVEERDENGLSWIWNTNVTSTAVALEGFARRKDNVTLAAPLARWLVAAQTNSRWTSTHDNALALEALVRYYRVFEADEPHMTAQVSLGSSSVGRAAFNGRSAEAQRLEVPMADLLKQAASAPLSISRTGTGRLFYTARVDAFTPAPAAAADRGFLVERRYEKYGKDPSAGPATSFAAGDLIRVTVSLTLRGEGRYLALTDPLPAGFEPLDDWALTTASDVAAKAREVESADWRSWWYGGYFDHVEKHDDRVLAFATALGSGRHEFSYLVRATTAGSFEASGATVEAMYAPEVTGRSAAATVTVR